MGILKALAELFRGVDAQGFLGQVAAHAVGGIGVEKDLGGQAADAQCVLVLGWA